MPLRDETVAGTPTAPDTAKGHITIPTALSKVLSMRPKKYVKQISVRAVPEIILRGSGPQTLFCPVEGGCFVDNVSEGWGVEG